MFIGSILVLLSGILFGIIPLITMALYDSGLNTISVSFYRYLFIVPIILVIKIFTRSSLRIKWSDIFNIITRLGIISVLTSILLAGSYTYISTGAATTLHFMYPIVVIMISVFYYREKLPKKVIIAICLVIVGIILFMINIEMNSIVGILMAMMSAVTYSLYILQLEKSRLNRLDPTVLSFYLASTTATTLLVISTFFQPIVFGLSQRQIIIFFILGILTFFALTSFQIGSRYLGAKLSAMLSLSEPITSVVIGIWYLNEPLNTFKIAGSLLILLAILIITYRKE